MAATKLLLMSRPIGPGQPSYTFSNVNRNQTSLFKCTGKSCIIKSKQGFNGDKSTRQKFAPPVKAALAPAKEFVETKIDKGLDLVLLLRIVLDLVLHGLKIVTKRRPWRRLCVQTFMEKVIIDCRFFTLFAVGGSLLGSILCFVEGCFLVVESYFQYFFAIAPKSDQGNIMQLLIEALDMFLVGTAILTFGMSLYVMFVGSSKSSQLHHGVTFYELPYLKSLQSMIGVGSVMQAKSKIGEAVLMLLQVGVLEKFKSVPLVTGLDLACFAGAVFVSSASTFLLSRLTTLAVITSTQINNKM